MIVICKVLQGSMQSQAQPSNSGQPERSVLFEPRKPRVDQLIVAGHFLLVNYRCGTRANLMSLPLYMSTSAIKACVQVMHLDDGFVPGGSNFMMHILGHVSHAKCIADLPF